MKKCPYCNEEIQDSAIKCRFCGEWLNKQDEPSSNIVEPNASNATPPQPSLAQQSTVVTPPLVRQKEQTMQYAGFWKRTLASIIDSFITIGFGLILLLLLFFIFDRNIVVSNTQIQSSTYIAIYYIYSIIIVWLYYALMESSRRQATLGKMALGIKVTDLNGNRVVFGKATGRHFGKIISGLILSVGFIMVAFTQKKQGLHDIMAGCLVVNRSFEYATNGGAAIEQIISETEAGSFREAQRTAPHVISKAQHNDEEFIELVKSSINENGLDNIPGKELLEIYHRAKFIDAAGNNHDIELSKTINTLSDELKKRGLSPDVKPQEKARFEESSSLEKEERKAATAKVVIAIILVVAIAVVFLFLNDIRSNSPNQTQSNYTVTETQAMPQELTAEVWVEKAKALLVDGKYTDPQQAIEYLSNAIKLEPNHVKAYLGRGFAYNNIGQYQRAIIDYDEAIRLAPDDPMAYFGRALSNDDLGKYQRAIEDYSEAIRLKPDNQIVYYFRGLVYAKLDQHKLAIDDFTESLRLSPDYSSYFARGNSYFKLNNYKLAIEDYNKAILLKTDYATAYQNRGLAYILQNKKRLGCGDLQKACDLGDCRGLELYKSKGYCN